MIKKERFDREHEDILREIRHGLLRYGGAGPGKPSPRNNSDETYMYDDDMLRHWYDEPPYESDPEELLMEHANNRYVIPIYMYCVDIRWNSYSSTFHINKKSPATCYSACRCLSYYL